MCDQKIQIIGGGTFGLSTAYHLAKNGYTDITVIDREEVPSKFSAGYDLNKIIRPEYEDQFYTNLALDAISMWESDDFKPYYHKVGYVNCNSSKAPKKTLDVTDTFFNSLISNDKFPKGGVEKLTTEEDFKRVLPLDIDFKGWSGYYNRHAGYAHALKALQFVAKDCKRMGVKFVVDRIECMVYSSTKKCLGVMGESGEIYRADLTIMAMGAHISKVFPDLAVTPKAWSVGHLHLSEEEAAPLKDMPVFNCRDIGFCFEPDEDNNILKMCNSSAGWVNCEKTDISVPTESNDGVCEVDKEALDYQAKIFFPNVDKPVVDRKICWCCDRTNSDFVIDYHPDYTNLLLATADSGHGFKMLPIFGKWVLGRIQNNLSEEQSSRWKWFEDEKEIDDVSWRLGKVMNLSGEERF
ncbi:putative L-saccharopine oxidase [[Candida] jaroonii]|uniref:L-saccharopine oxidase n=1 Tax=[Candida] jaroonii TaxID=467808 RepID=A0ACA9YE65_9ASCO|nr:putative L-saccharopine oxidase [[Candida] jaroonii]